MPARHDPLAIGGFSMLVGVPKEIKVHEYRVGMTPTSVRELTHHGHQAIVQKGAGKEIGLLDKAYAAAGAEIVDTAEEIFARAEMVVKVKEPQPNECRMLRPGQVLFTYLHLAPDPEQTRLLVESGAVAIAYETVTDRNGRLPLLAPMSEVAGRMSIQAGAHCLEKSQKGAGMLLGGVPGVPPAKVVVLGGGVVGTNAARVAMGMEADVTILDKSIDRLRQLDELFGGKLNTIYATVDNIETYVLGADVVIGAALVPGAEAPKLVSERMVRQMRRGSVLVDVSIDQGGCFETSRPTTHAKPTYVVHGVVHYCVANMPGAVARTSTFALNNATLPFVMALADKGYKKALTDDPHLLQGLNVHAGKVTYKAVADALGYQALDARKAIAA
jgi:alanine dehydrogenase